MLLMSRPLTPLSLTVLRLLAIEPMHPYEMQQRIRKYAFDHVVKVTHGSLYHSVDRLTATGLIEPVEVVRDGRRPERTVYAITDAGRDEAHAQLGEYLMRPAHDYPCLGMALAFIDMLPPAEVADLLARRALMLEGELAAHVPVIEGLFKKGLSRVQVVDIEFAQARRRAELEYVRALGEDIKSGRLSWGKKETHE